MSPLPAASPDQVRFATSVHLIETTDQLAYMPDWVWERDQLERSEILHDLPASPTATFRHSGWAGDRAKVHAALQRTRQQRPRIASFETCGSGAFVLQAVDDPTRYRIAGSACHDRFCLPCGQERSRTIAGNVLDRLDGKGCRFLTLTVSARGLALIDAIKHLQRSFRRLRKTKLWARCVTGGAAFLEVKWIQATERWHPHLHCLLEGRYMPQPEIKAHWERITGDSSIVDIRPARNQKMIVHYVVKYASKPLDHSLLESETVLDEAILALRGIRLCVTFGTWQGLKLTATGNLGEWLNVGSLEEWLQRAAWGDAEAEQVLVSIGRRRAIEAIAEVGPRPPPTITIRPTTQLRFDFQRPQSLVA